MIPKRIIYCWFGKKKKPWFVEKCIASWKKYMPDWEYLEINEDNFDINSIEYSKNAYDAKMWAFVGDPIRLWALYTYGGIYLDTDVEVFQSFDNLLDNELFIGVEQPHYFGNATIGCKKGNNIIKTIFEQYKSGKEKWELKTNWTEYRTGPMILTDILSKYVDRDSMDYQKTNEITVYPKKYFVNHDKLDNEVYCKHHMLGSWCNNDTVKEQDESMKIAFYIPFFNHIGGIESWIYYISKLYGKNRDITVYYVSGDEKQIDRLLPLVKIKKFYQQSIECDLAIFAAVVSDNEIRCFNAKKEKVQFIHACYSVAYVIKKFEMNPLIDRYIAVSQTAADDFYKISGSMPEVIHNPIYFDKPKKVLKLISATRIAEDKGSIWEKMQILARKLIEKDIPFIWLVFTNNTKIKTDIRGFCLMPPELKITDYIADADYLVQLSKTEADCLSVKESLCVGTPILATNFAAAIENGVVDGKTGYIFDMDMSNVDVEKIYNNIPKFEYKVNNSEKEWNALLGKPCKVKKDKMVEVVCKVDHFWDVEYQCTRKRGEKWIVDSDRARSLVNSKQKKEEGFTILQLVDIIE